MILIFRAASVLEYATMSCGICRGNAFVWVRSADIVLNICLHTLFRLSLARIVESPHRIARFPCQQVG